MTCAGHDSEGPRPRHSVGDHSRVGRFTWCVYVYMYLYVCLFLCTCLCVCVYVYIRAHTHTNTHLTERFMYISKICNIHMHAGIHTCMHTYIHTCTNIQLLSYPETLLPNICACMHTYIHAHICTYSC